MDEQEKPTLPDDPPITVDEDEVERLLSQAEDLADEIATTAGVTPDDKDADSPPELPAPEPEKDLLSAEQDVEAALSQLSDLVTGAQAEGGRSDAEPAKETQDTPAVPAAIEDAAAADDPAAGPAAAAPPVEGSDGSDLSDESCTDVDADPGEPTDRDAADDRADGERPPKRGRAREHRPLKARLAAIPGTARHAVRSVAAAAGRAVITTLVVLDRPFAGLSPKTKKRIGQIGIVTVLMGIASLILPKLLRHNPYIDIEL